VLGKQNHLCCKIAAIFLLFFSTKIIQTDLYDCSAVAEVSALLTFCFTVYFSFIRPYRSGVYGIKWHLNVGFTTTVSYWHTQKWNKLMNKSCRMTTDKRRKIDYTKQRCMTQ